MSPVEYIPRLIEGELEGYLNASGAILIVGPKWCGKTTTAKRYAKSVLDLRDEDKIKEYMLIADQKISLLLKGDNPRLIDEWQVIPRLWDAVRYDVDNRDEAGSYILTGSRIVDNDSVKHSGAGRIARLKMGTMSLYEQKISTGEVSIAGLFNGTTDISGTSDLDYSKLAKAVVRGGWPATVGKTEDQTRRLISSYCKTITETDISTVDGKQRDSVKAELILRSLSRGSSSPVNNAVVEADVSRSSDVSMHRNTVLDYISALEKLYVVDDLPAWNPNLRSKTAIRSTPIRHFADPAIAAHFLNASSEDLEYDPLTFGLLFESMAVRDIRVYAQAMGGTVYHYRDGDGLEADAIVHLNNGKWGAVEIKLGSRYIEEAAENLKKLRGKIDTEHEHLPSFLAVVTGTEYAYRRDDGIFVIPIGCLKN
jgi:predicted AAA+ superfamily ATPase